VKLMLKETAKIHQALLGIQMSPHGNSAAALAQ
jgi:hypothetical protein